MFYMHEGNLILSILPYSNILPWETYWSTLNQNESIVAWAAWVNEKNNENN
jgi:hypothetical protein